MTGLPEAARRWFFGYAADLGPDDPFVVRRLLEEGDGPDLQHLTTTLGAAGLETWWRTHRGRGLSRRSRAFWALLLDPSGEAEDVASELWPL